ncbi:MAG: hypothetical protein IT359_01305 [Gemmatimonadaceae bacterium]|nr:hypothetical protein [Gemmatimonadaceae bacterium]
MQLRIIRVDSRNPLVGILLLVVILALLAFVLTAGMALLAGGAVLGTVGYIARRLLGGKRLGATGSERERLGVAGDEVFAPGQPLAARRPVDVRSLPEAERD